MQWDVGYDDRCLRVASCLPLVSCEVLDPTRPLLSPISTLMLSSSLFLWYDSLTSLYEARGSRQHRAAV